MRAMRPTARTGWRSGIPSSPPGTTSMRSHGAARDRYEEALAETEANEATLAQVRKAKSLTQTTIAMIFDIDQLEVSRLERRRDMLLSTLRSFIQAAGGELQLVATFRGSRPVHLLVGSDASPRRRPGGAAAATSVQDGWQPPPLAGWSAHRRPSAAMAVLAKG